MRLKPIRTEADYNAALKEIERSLGYWADEPEIQDWIDNLLAEGGKVIN